MSQKAYYATSLPSYIPEESDMDESQDTEVLMSSDEGALDALRLRVAHLTFHSSEFQIRRHPFKTKQWRKIKILGVQYDKSMDI